MGEMDKSYGEGLYGANNPIDFDRYMSDENLQYTANLLKSDFGFFITFFFRYIYHDDFRFQPFHDEIVKSLEEFVYGNPAKKNLGICIPPRWGKSIAMIMWIPWCLAINPRCNFIYTCYEERITNKMSDDILNIIRSPFYQKLFNVELSGSTEAKALWETKEKGTYRASPLGGAMTGFGCKDYNVEVFTELGYKKISDIVENRENIKVWCVDDKNNKVLEDIDVYVKNDDSRFKRIVLDNGEIIDSTTDHIFFTTEGDKRCDELTVDSILLSDSANNISGYRKFINKIFSRIVLVADNFSLFFRRHKFIPSVASTSANPKSNSFSTPVDSALNVRDISMVKSKIFGNLLIGTRVLGYLSGYIWRNLAVPVMRSMSNAISRIIRLSSIRKIFNRIIHTIAVKMSNLNAFFLLSKKSPSDKAMNIKTFRTSSLLGELNCFISPKSKFFISLMFKLYKRYKNLIGTRGENFSVSADKISFKVGNRRIFAIYNIHNKSSYCLTLKRFNNFFVGRSRLFVHNCGNSTDDFGGAFIVDDPLNAKFFNSKAEKQKVLDVYQSVIKKRLNNPAKTPIVMIMQRLAMDDLVGYIKKNEIEDWKFIEVPALNEKVNPPRSNWEWKSPTDVLLKEKAQSPYVFAAQMQQKPIVLGGELCKEEWFKYYNSGVKQEYIKVYMCADTAFKNNEYSDYTALGLFGLTKQKQLHLIDLLHKKIDAVDLQKEFLNFWHKWNNGVWGRRVSSLHVEDKASGMQLIQDLRKKGGIPIIAFKDRGFDKLTKWNELFPNIESGNIYLPNGRTDPISNVVINEMITLCGDMSHEHDDICDMLYMGNNVAFSRVGIF